MGHAKPHLQPSSLKRTINCPPWAVHYEPSPSGEAAMEGSIAHALAEISLYEDKEPYEYVGRTGYYDKKKGEAGLTTHGSGAGINTDRFYRQRITDEMAENVKVYTDYVRKRVAEVKGCDVSFENKLDMSFLIPGMHGTADTLIIQIFGETEVIDLKYGYGLVEVPENAQLMAYALGAIGDDNPNAIETVRTTIVQPRASHPDGPIRSAVYSVEDILAWAKEKALIGVNSAELALKWNSTGVEIPEKSYQAGEWCKFCPMERQQDPNGMPICPALKRQFSEASEEVFGGEIIETGKTLPNPAEFPGKKIGKMLTILEDIIEPWIKNFKAEAYRRLTDNDDPPEGWKLVEGRAANRKFAVSDIEVYTAVKLFLDKEEVFEEKLITPAQLETKLKKAGLKPAEVRVAIDNLLEERKPGKPKMAKQEDPAPEISTAEQMFGAPEA